MSVEIVTDYRVLLRLAFAVGNARKAGDYAALAKAEAELTAYEKLCLSADRMTLGVTTGAL